MWDDNNSENESEEDVEESQQNFKPTFVVIAIDNHPLMFRKREDKSIPFKDCLSACHALADSLLFNSSSRSWNQFAVLVANEESPCLTEFRDNLIKTVKLLKTKASLPDKQLAEEYQRKGEFDLAAFFLMCKKVFHDIKTPFYKRSLIYITDDDNPVQDNSKKFTALNEVRTFCGNQIDFQVIRTRKDFDYSIFYNELFSLLENPPSEEIFCEDKEGLTEKLTSAVVMKQIQRKLLFYPFKGESLRFINCFKLDYIRASKLNNSMLTRDGKAVKSTTENGDEFVDTKYFFKCKASGREGIQFDSYERNCTMDNTLPKGLSLLYVSKRTTEVGYVLAKPFFLKPKKEDDVYFNKFWQCCVDNERVLVCALKQKEFDKIRYTELIPTMIYSSPVFLVKYIPYSTEIILPKKTDYVPAEPNKKKKESIKKIVDDLTFDFDLQLIPDPCYLKKKEYVKAKLLDEPMEEVNDVAFNIKGLDEHLKEAVDMINSSYSFVEERKRKAAAGPAKAKKSGKVTKY